MCCSKQTNTPTPLHSRLFLTRIHSDNFTCYLLHGSPHNTSSLLLHLSVGNGFFFNAPSLSLRPLELPHIPTFSSLHCARAANLSLINTTESRRISRN